MLVIMSSSAHVMVRVISACAVYTATYVMNVQHRICICVMPSMNHACRNTDHCIQHMLCLLIIVQLRRGAPARPAPGSGPHTGSH